MENENMRVYSKVRTVPETAKKIIGGGKLKGMTDINPMWRIEQLTELFGPCGVGWYTDILSMYHEQGANGEVAAILNLNLFVKVDGEWSKPIFGTGGSMLIQIEKGKLITNDECYKMAYTDAVSVACKALGFGADVYWAGGRTKYSKYDSKDDENNESTTAPSNPGRRLPTCTRCNKPIALVEHDGKVFTTQEIIKKTVQKYGAQYCWECAEILKRTGEIRGNN